MSRLAAAAWDVPAKENSHVPFKNTAARQARKAVSKVDCGRRGLSENNSTAERTRPVGRTAARPMTTAATKSIEVTMPDESCTDINEIARTIMPDYSDEWQMVENTKITAGKWEPAGQPYKAVVDQQKRLIHDLKKNIEKGRTQRAAFLDRIAAMGRQLHSELSQLSTVKNDCARADALREDIAKLEEQLGSIEQEVKEATKQAQALAVELTEKQAASKSKEDEVSENKSMLEEALSAAATAHQDCESERTQLSEDLAACDADCAKLRESMADLEAKISKSEKDTVSTIAAHEKEVANLEVNIETASAERKELAEAATVAETEATKLKSLQETNETNLASVRNTLEGCRATMMQHKSDADKTEEELAGQEKENDRLREQEASLKQTQTNLTEEISSLHAQKDQLHAQNHRVSEEIGDLQEQCDALSDEQKKLTELNSKLEATIVDNQGKTKLAEEAAAKAQQKHTEISCAVSIKSQQLAEKETEQAAAEAEEITQTTRHEELIAEKVQLTKAHENFVVEKPKTLKKIEVQSAELEELRTKHGAEAKEQMAKVSAKHAEERELQAEYDALEANVGAKRDKIQAVRDLIASQELEIEAMQKAEIASEAQRRKLHNKITELKGNIRVFCRVRPIKDSELLEGQASDTVTCPTDSSPSEKETIDLTMPGVNASNTGGEARDRVKHSFGFDKVFPMQSTQEEVFDEVSTLVQSALDGYKVCIFAYGQTGSGKTHTMQGGDQPNTEGIIPRSIVHILNEARRLQAQGWAYTLTATFLEIYNEKIRDLLLEAPQKPRKGSGTKDSGAIDVKYNITHDDMGNTTVSNMTMVEVASLADVSDLMARAEKQRSVSATAMNSRSSRSHSVFTLRLSGRNDSQGTALSGVLNLVDLAGSERLNDSGATGSRQKETQAINKSLSSLGDVFVALSNKSQHVPYRNSELTKLLRPCLGGDGKTLMMLNLSPAPASYQQSLCSLRFGSKVNGVDMGHRGRGAKREIHAIETHEFGEELQRTQQRRRHDTASTSATPARGLAAKQTRGPGVLGSAAAKSTAKKPKQAW